MKRFVPLTAIACLAWSLTTARATVFINEVFINPPGSSFDDTREFIELAGTPGMRLDGYAIAYLHGALEKYYPLGSIPPAPVAQEIDEFLSLDGLQLGENGMLVLLIGLESEWPTIVPDTAVRANWDSSTDPIWNGNLADPPGKFENDGSGTFLLIRRRPGVTEADPANPLGPRWFKDSEMDAELITPVVDPQDGIEKDQWGDGELDKGQENGIGGFTTDMKGALTLEDLTDDLEIVDEFSWEHERGWEYDLDGRDVDLGSTDDGLPERRVHALDDPQGINPDCFTRVDYRTKGEGWAPVGGATGELPNGNNWQDTATEQWVRGESVVAFNPAPEFYYDNTANTDPAAIQPFNTHVPLWLDDGIGEDYDFSTTNTYRISAGAVNPLAVPFIPGDADRDGDCDADDVAKVAAVLGDDDWIFSNSFSEAPEGDSGDPATQTRPWDVDGTGDNGIECSDLQWVLNFQGNTDGRILGRTYDSDTPSATGVALNDNAGTEVTVATAVTLPPGRTQETLVVGDVVTLTVAAQLTGGANATPGEENGVMQYVHDLALSTGGVLAITAVTPAASFATTRADLLVFEGSGGDLGVRRINGHTTSFTAGVSGTADLYTIELEAVGLGATTASLAPTLESKFSLSTPHGLKLGHTAANGDPEASAYPEALSFTVVSGDVPISIIASDPADGAIDARQPSNPDGTSPAGWSAVTLTFDGDPAALTPGDFTVAETGGDGIAPGVLSATPLGGNDLLVALTSAIGAGAWTTLTHTDSGTSVTLGFLPADANGDGTSAAQDLLALIDSLNGVNPLPLRGADIDRTGVAAAPDVLRLIDLLNGAGVYDPWIGVSLP